MDRQSNQYMFLFAIIVCLVCSVALSLVSEGLRAQKELNVALDMKKNILKAVGLREPVNPKSTPQEILKTYENKISEIVVNDKGDVVEGKDPAQIGEGEKLFPIFIYKEGEQVLAYCFPIIGKGLWSTLYGYFALEPDAKTVRGITYYKHGETPGLGAEIEKAWFQDNFKGKKIWDEAKKDLRPTAVVKGEVDAAIGKDADKPFYVDGISGATMTAKGVTEMISRELRKYEPYFSKIRG